MTYSTTRFGIYEELKQRFAAKGEAASLPLLIGMSSLSGFVGGVAGTPADVMNVRMQHDAALPKEAQKNYKHAIDGLTRMAREEGIRSLWKGVWPNSIRASMMTASQLASYDWFKAALLRNTSMKDNTATHFTSSILAGLVATTICSPVDVIKTRVMSSTAKTGLSTLLADIYRKEGLTWMFKGWVPSFIRLGPHTIVTFLFLEQHKKIYRSWKRLDV